MKVRHVVCWSALVALPHFALAATPPGELGAFQAIYDFCAKVDPQQRKDLSIRADALFRDLTKQQIASIRQSTEYQRGYKLLSSVLPKLTSDDALSGCVALAPPASVKKLGLQKRP
jgi:hypothetical protein